MRGITAKSKRIAGLENAVADPDTFENYCYNETPPQSDAGSRDQTNINRANLRGYEIGV